MRSQKSSKKTTFLVVFFVLIIGMIIGGYFVLNSSFSVASLTDQLDKILEENTKPITGCKPDSSDKNKDSDNDGLMDWEETTWKTDPCRPDSDSDGYLDGEEATSGYDPTTPAPNDILPGADPNNPRSLPNNLTQILAEKLTKEIVSGKMGQVSDALSPSTINTSNEIVNGAIQEIINRAVQEFSIPHIPDEEIIISSDNSDKNIESYARKISKILSDQTASNNQTSEIEAIYFAIQNNSFNKLEGYAEFYKRISEEIRQIPVPSILKEVHKEQIGIFQVTSRIHQAIANIQKDPLKANLAIDQYEAIVNSSFETSRKIIDILSNK